MAKSREMAKKLANKRNIKRFEGEDYMFQLTKEECLRSQIVTLNEAQGKHLKYMPYAFTMLGTAMLSSVLRSETAIQTNRKIMRAFVAYRHLAELPIAATYLELRKEIEAVRSEMNDILADQNRSCGVGSSDHFQEPVILIMIHYCLNSHIICLDK